MRIFLTRTIDFFYPPLRHVMPAQVFRYAACGAINMVLDAALYYIVFHFLLCESDVQLGYFTLSAEMSALAVVFPITFFNGFWLNRNIAFSNSKLGEGTQLWRYAASVAGSIVLTATLMKLLIDLCGIWPTPSKMATTLLVAAYSYLMQKYFTFRN